MWIRNAVVNGERCAICIENGKITAIAPTQGTGWDAGGRRVIPGLIDVHTHGCVGWDTMDAELSAMCRFYAQAGTTSFLPTPMTMDHARIKRALTVNTACGGAQVLGFHLEGPFISPQYKGAQDEGHIRLPSLEEWADWPYVKMVTLAPELAGSMAFIRAVSPHCVVSLGHTACDYETAMEAAASGARCLTHLFNAMPPLLHRAAGPIGAGVAAHMYAQLICDGLHVSRPAVLAAWRMFGADRIVLISDSIRPAGLPDGVYEAGGLPVTVKDGQARLADGTLAGSCATLWMCVKQAVAFGIPFPDAVRAATQNPAELLGIRKGQIAVGYDADLLVVNDDMTIHAVMIGGEWYE